MSSASVLVQVGDDDVFRDYERMLAEERQRGGAHGSGATTTATATATAAANHRQPARLHPSQVLLKKARSEREASLIVAFREYRRALSTASVYNFAPTGGYAPHQCTCNCKWWTHGDLFVCTFSGNFHVCTATECPYWTEDEKEGVSVCRRTANVREKSRLCDQIWDQSGHQHYSIPAAACAAVDALASLTSSSSQDGVRISADVHDPFGGRRYKSARVLEQAPALSGQRKRKKPDGQPSEDGKKTRKQQHTGSTGSSRKGRPLPKRRKRAVPLDEDAVLVQRADQAIRRFLQYPSRDGSTDRLRVWIRTILHTWHQVVTTTAFQAHGETYPFTMHCQVVLYHMHRGLKVGRHEIQADPLVADTLRLDELTRKPTPRKFTASEKLFLFSLGG